ncbi:hypothetical protein Ptr902_11615 [Pyrenophora tritici-repentis]|nr:hypothetical protein Ptr902_11615 [Pyrenophora tritici-repentis]
MFIYQSSGDDTTGTFVHNRSLEQLSAVNLITHQDLNLGFQFSVNGI